jgi:ubiquinone/menaquinone biosynthesis C-methylase UbiE
MLDKPFDHILKCLCCPKCRGQIVLKNEVLFSCLSCKEQYQIVNGIPDFRVFDPPYVDIPADIEMANKLAAKFASLAYDDLVRFRMELSKEQSPGYPDDLLEAHTQGRLIYRRKIVEKILHLFDKISQQKGFLETESKPIGLDIGCGTGPGLIAMSKKCDISIGADILMADMLLAQKLLESESIKNFYLVCCCAEHLPFKKAAFSLVTSRDVIEHVRDQKIYLSEALRVLRKGGFFLFNSPNRLMLKLEPHVKLKRVGFLPRCLQSIYVKLRRKEAYKERLLSLFELKSMISGLSVKYELLNPEKRIDFDSNSTSVMGRFVRSVPFFANIINRYYYIFQYEHEIIIVNE